MRRGHILCGGSVLLLHTRDAPPWPYRSPDMVIGLSITMTMISLLGRYPDEHVN